MTLRTILLCGCALSLTALANAAPALAQEQPAVSLPDSVEDNEIVVTAARIRGSVDVPQAPIAVLDEADIASYGAGSLADLVEQLAPQTASASGRGGGRPAFLVNGRRINGFREMRNYPPEAIRRIEVLPEEVALRFGFRPDQRVINFILKDNFNAITAEAELGLPSGGGFATSEQEVSLLRIDGANRLNLAFEAEDSSLLTEAERGVSSVDAPILPGDVDPAATRSLVADTRDLQLNANWSRALGKDGVDGDLSLSGTVTRSDSRALRGADGVVLADAAGNSAYRTLLDPGAGFGARERVSRSEGFEVGAGYNRPLGDWRLSATANWAHDETRTRTDASLATQALRDAVADGNLPFNAPAAALLASGLIDPRGADTALANTETATSLVTLTGRPLEIPAGEVAVVVKTGYAWNNIQSRDTRNPGVVTDLTRGDASAGFSLGMPIASRRADVLSAIGDLSLDLSGGASHLSDFGTLFDGSAGLTWGVTRNLSLSASYLYRQAAPTLQQLGAPQIVSTGATVYDFATGQTAVVDLLSGGNPDLIAESRNDWKFALNWDVPVLERSRIIAEYYDENSRDVSASFPVLTPAVEAAFPGRVTRDAAGNLLAIDQRPVTFASQTSRRIRYGVDISDKIAGNDRSGEGGRAGGRDGGAGRGEGRGERRGEGRRGGADGMPRIPGMGRGGDGGGRWNLALYHTVRLADEVRIADGGPVLDLLGGAALAGSARPRHSVEMEGGIFKDGIGLRLSGNYSGGSRIEGSGLPGSRSLDFHPYATFNLRGFVDLERKFEDVAFLKGSRLSLRIDNLFDAQQRVTDEFGTVPASYQPAFLDPRGRFFEIDFRKRF